MSDKASLEKQDGARASSGRASFSRIVQRVLELIEGVFCIVATVTLVLMSLLVGADIIGRYAFNNPIPGVYDSIHLLMVWVVFLSLAYTQKARRHIKVTLLINRFPSDVRNRFTTASYILAFILCAIVTWQAWGMALNSVIVGQYYPGTLNLPIYPSKLVAFAGMLILTIRFLADTVASLRQSGVATEAG